MDLKKLEQKGWQPHELSKFSYLWKFTSNKRHPTSKRFDGYMFWIILVTAIVENILLPIVLIPLFALTTPLIYLPAAASIAVIFGYFFVFLLGHLDNIKKHHHTIAIITIAILVTANVWISTIAANYLIDSIPLTNSYTEPIIPIAIILVPFLIPYVAAILRR